MIGLNLSICVVLYGSVEVSKRFHTELLASLEDFQDYEIIYYDNSPSDQLRTWLEPKAGEPVSYTWDPRNLGFAYANNEAILRAKYPKILLLNPDVFGFSPEVWLEISRRETAQHAWFVRLLNSDGTFQDCVGEPSSISRIFRKRPDYASMQTACPVGMGIMAFMLTEKSVFAHVGLLDCDYPLYAEDMDWCHRARKKGIRVMYDPTIALTHIGGSSAKDRWHEVESLRRKYRAERIFIDKHYRGLHGLIMRLLNTVKRTLKARRA